MSAAPPREALALLVEGGAGAGGGFVRGSRADRIWSSVRRCFSVPLANPISEAMAAFSALVYVFLTRPRTAPGPSDLLKACEKRAILQKVRAEERVKKAREAAVRGPELKAAQGELKFADEKLDEINKVLREKYEDLDSYPVPPYLEKCYGQGRVLMAVTGGSGVGKSTFINTIRRAKSRSEKAAETGVTETTCKPQMFTFWPGRAGVFNRVFDQMGKILRLTCGDKKDSNHPSSVNSELCRVWADNESVWKHLDQQELVQPGDRVLLRGLPGQPEEFSGEVLTAPPMKAALTVQLENGEVIEVSKPQVRGVLAECAIWDLPGVGTVNFPQATYMREMGVRHFDLVVLMTASRFTEAELNLVEELQRWQVPFFLVRNKTDFAVEAEIQEFEEFHGDSEGFRSSDKQKKDIEKATLAHIKASFKSKYGFDQVYCISSRYKFRERFDLLLLEHDMEAALREQRVVLASELAPLVEAWAHHQKS